MEWAIRELTLNDLDALSWSGRPAHLLYIATALERAARNEIAYLAVCENETVMGIGAVDFVRFPDSAVLWQLMVHPDYRSQGFGTALVAALEQRAADRDIHNVELAVEITNPRAQDLYHRLGYRVAETYVDTWIDEDDTGATRKHEAMCVVMRKTL